MKHTRVVAVIAAVVVVFTLVGCAPQANQIGAVIPIPPLGSFISGFLQGAFIVWVLIWNLLASIIPGMGHFDAYQDAAGVWYDLGFIIGLVVFAGSTGFLVSRGARYTRRSRV